MSIEIRPISDYIEEKSAASVSLLKDAGQTPSQLQEQTEIESQGPFRSRSVSLSDVTGDERLVEERTTIVADTKSAREAIRTINLRRLRVAPSEPFRRPENFPFWAVFFNVLSVFTVGAALTIIAPFSRNFIAAFELSSTSSAAQIDDMTSIVLSSYLIGRFVSSLFWGWGTDRFGRKHVITIGLIFSALCGIAFTFTETFLVAFLVRFAGAAMDGGVLIACKSSVFELLQPKFQILGMSALAMCITIGAISGPLIGDYFGNLTVSEQFFQSNPYLLPMIVFSSIALVVLIGVLRYIPETFGKKERERLNNLRPDQEALESLLQREFPSGSPTSPTESLLSPETPSPNPVPDDTDDNQNRDRGGGLIQQADQHTSELKPRPKATRRRSLNKRCCPWRFCGFFVPALTLGIWSFINTWLLMIYPQFARADRHNGGLGLGEPNFDPSGSFGVLTISISVVVLFIAHLWILPILQRKIGATKSFQLMIVFCGIISLLFPALSLITASTEAILTSYLILHIIHLMLWGFGLAALFFILNRSVSPNRRGKVHGLSLFYESLAIYFAQKWAENLYLWSLNAGDGFPMDDHTSFYVLPIFCLVLFPLTLCFRKHLAFPSLEEDREMATPV